MNPKITVCKTKNGWVIIERDLACIEKPDPLMAEMWSFDSLPKAMSKIKSLIEPWHHNVIPEWPMILPSRITVEIGSIRINQWLRTRGGV